ncbi:MAG: recombinase family protein [Oscillospiraceae bacterium]|nr:recombinase family protein [Oscillospiraceae bacterium]
MAIAKNVTVIPAKVNPVTGKVDVTRKKRRVAGYARVSTDSDEQFTSYEAQVDYYTNFIQANPDWEFVKVYTDAGISGLNTKNRDGFNSMIADALAGGIDLIVTKSVSRFARNTVDSLTTVRKLREHGVEVFFQKENIYTLDSQGELLITIMSSLAQEESRSISENVTWGQRKRFADGKVSMAYKRFLGYRKGPDGLPEIDPEEAEIVRNIYRWFMEGHTYCTIASLLTKEGILTPGGKQKWQPNTVKSILTNEKYMGAALLQKSFTVDYLQKKMKRNEGEVPQYYVAESHPAIIDPEEWRKVQAEVAHRIQYDHKAACASPFSGKIVCGDCGTVYGSKVWHSTDRYRRVIWQCNSKYGGEHKCKTPHLTEQQIQNAFCRAINPLLSDRARIIGDLEAVKAGLSDDADLMEKQEKLAAEMEALEALMHKAIMVNAETAQDQKDYNRRYDGYAAKHEKLKKQYGDAQAEREARQNKAQLLDSMIDSLIGAAVVTEFDVKLWNATVDHVTVNRDGSLVFTMRDGREIRVKR